MAINKVNTTAEEKSFNFLTNQSTILRTVDTNNITVNGVNVIVDKPKRGDVMCVTKYKNDSGTLLDADKQKVIWIDGLSINPDYLSEEYEPVGICIVVNGNKAIIKYREEKDFRWSAGERWEMPQLLPIITNKSHSFRIKLNGTYHPNLFEYHYNSLHSAFKQEQDFVNQLNDWFLANNRNYSTEVVDKNTDLPLLLQETGNYRIIVNARFTGGTWNTFSMDDVNDGTTITPTRAIGKPVEAVNWYYLNNGFTRNFEGGCCRAKYYDYIQRNQQAPTGPMTDINIVTGSTLPKFPARLVAFTDNPNCQILRDNFSNYDEYLESMLVKVPCGAGGLITEFPSGKENTYKLANCTFLDNATGEQSPLYLAANWAASISLNAPKLGKGNWWLPSSAEMVQMMRDITYDTSFWEANPDIINRVLAKLTSISNSGWSMLSASAYRWASSKYDQFSAYIFNGNVGHLTYYNFCGVNRVVPITIYEF